MGEKSHGLKLFSFFYLKLIERFVSLKLDI